MKPENHKKVFNCTSIKEFTSIVEKGCTRCSLSEHRAGPIVYRGNINSKILLLGEAPGKAEIEVGEPFRGPAGILLDKIFEVTTGLNTDKDMLLGNVSFCRPVAPMNSGKQNYTPKNDQLDRCFPFIEKFIDLAQPKIIIACGRTALQQLTGDKRIKMGDWEGRWLRYKEKIPMFAQIHPAAILHMINFPDKQHEAKKKVSQYMKYFKETYKGKLK